MASSTLLTRGTVLVDEETQALANEAVKAAGDDKIAQLTFTTETGVVVPLPPRVVELLSNVLNRVALGGAMSVQTMPDLLTTSAAAELLGVSRPTVMKLIRDGVLTPVMAGSHHRLHLREVAAVRAHREQARQEAIETLIKLGDDRV
ncbi:helix-turn-helix domain-containing protein [Microbacterium luteolum]|uniref:Helix-turn-helix domain-containing protein n=1 Tax=Microbacterium luteolum TaxID=69367 RepID=A0ABY7XSZ1_MICLT|nr:helix-turn-helix domain-containing protein [Microbacterium luteolum]WDM45316.1 helix-turn-helix domain-containing protein [Microbacterium luteolum]